MKMMISVKWKLWRGWAKPAARLKEKAVEEDSKPAVISNAKKGGEVFLGLDFEDQICYVYTTNLLGNLHLKLSSSYQFMCTNSNR